MAAPADDAQVRASIVQYLTAKGLPPRPSWVREFMPTIRLNSPVVALQKTALFRILSTDLTLSLQPSSAESTFPANVAAPEAEERRLTGPIAVQVLGIEDIGRSRWSQVETIEAIERGEMTKGREIIRVVDDNDDDDAHPNPNRTQANNTSAPCGPHKLLLQDAKGTKVYGFELEGVAGIGVQQLSIGAKFVLTNVMVVRGVVMLDAKSVELLGGKVDAWDKKWRAERKEVLKRKAGMTENAGG